jgi:hypothetical protein
MVTKLLVQEKDVILKNWIRLIIESYPAESLHFLQDNSDRFRNPVGHTIAVETELLFDKLFIDHIDDDADITVALDNIIKIRSVQDFSASEAVGFVFALKQVIRETLSQKGWEQIPTEELLKLESRIDRLALKAFDRYALCQERIYKIKVNEFKRRSNRLLQRTQMFDESVWQEERVDNDSMPTDEQRRRV